MMQQALNYDFVDLGNKYDTIPGGGWSGKHIRHNGVSKSYAISESNYLKALEHQRFHMYQQHQHTTHLEV